MSEFDTIRERMEAYDESREEVIKRSREILKASKHAIYSLHRKEGEKAQELLEQARSVIEGIGRLASKQPLLSEEGSYKQALEEYAEAAAFAHFLEQGGLLPLSALAAVGPEEYLKGLSDLTGELHRYAVNRAVEKDRDAVERARALVEEIYGELSRFDFRNSDLRRKYDAIKYNLQKLEQLRYELSG